MRDILLPMHIDALTVILSPLQKQIVFMLLDGFTLQDVSRKVLKHHSTLVCQLKNARRNTDCKTTYQLVALAARSRNFEHFLHEYRHAPPINRVRKQVRAA